MAPTPMPSSPPLSSLSAVFDAEGVALDDLERLCITVWVTSDSVTTSGPSVFWLGGGVFWVSGGGVFWVSLEVSGGGVETDVGGWDVGEEEEEGGVEELEGVVGGWGVTGVDGSNGGSAELLCLG